MPTPFSLPRLASVPPAEPPHESPAGPPGDLPRTDGSLALAPGSRPAAGRTEPYAVPDAVPYAVPGAAPRGAPGAVPDERRLRWLGQALAEILAGRRPPETVHDRLTVRAYRDLVRAGKMIDAERPPLVGVPHVQRPRPGAVEMCLLVHCGPRSRVLAVRLERYGVRWLVTDFETA
ncbi:hypothetical protein JOL79_19565 [Microbispora sp. RL4-1S]|uniref:Uncharacterized protein n=1 Tax=Microbispora oryzae TaxID=2806554 RepID=A0A940WI46_9ACTN|nr:Rv3235 family protein [Microbispora oryzae]MBP2706010.1 hypothetical protein [Microbispora oryzae]